MTQQDATQQESVQQRDSAQQEPAGIEVLDVAFVRFAAPDLDVMQAFLIDFGLVVHERDEDTLYMRGTGPDGFVHVTHKREKAGFVGLAFEAASVEDLEVLAKSSDFSAVEDLAGPCGGKVVRAVDPDGFEIEVVAGRDVAAPLDSPAAQTANNTSDRVRLGSPKRLEAGPSHVLRLGHCVLNVTDYRSSEEWYKKHFGLVTSDEIELEPGFALGAFLRCSAGKRFVDHHTLFLVGVGSPAFNHAAFEVANLDDLMLGNTHLTDTGHKHQWGVGRHVLGSQIYDYWLDPHGHMVEHWTDGDLYNDDNPPAIENLDTLLASQWGPMSGGPPA